MTDTPQTTPAMPDCTDRLVRLDLTLEQARQLSWTLWGYVDINEGWSYGELCLLRGLVDHAIENNNPPYLTCEVCGHRDGLDVMKCDECGNDFIKTNK